MVKRLAVRIAKSLSLVTVCLLLASCDDPHVYGSVGFSSYSGSGWGGQRRRYERDDRRPHPLAQRETVLTQRDLERYVRRCADLDVFRHGDGHRQRIGQLHVTAERQRA